MKKTLILLILIKSSILFAQFSEPITINSEWTNLRSIFLEDLNMDNSLDLIVFRNFDTHFYLNDGNGNFVTPFELDTDINRANDLDYGDIDGDGDMDLLISSGGVVNFSRLLWLENDGNLNFTQRDIIQIGEGLDVPFACNLTDLDNDGDLDAIVSSFRSDELYINYNDGAGNFAEPVIISEETDGPLKIKTIDINMDGFKEIFYINYFPSGTERIVFLSRNDLGNYESNSIGAPFFANPNGFDFIDIDFDGDMDIVTQWAGGARFTWMENIDNTGEFEESNSIWSVNTFENGAPLGFFVNQRSMNNELFFFTDEGFLYEINGTIDDFSEPFEIFQEEDMISDLELDKVAFGDINNDGNLDMVYINTQNNLVRMRTSNVLINTNEVEEQSVHIYPNPSSNELFVDCTSLSSLSIMNTSGQVLKTQNDDTLDVSQLPNGIYFLRIQYDYNKILIKKLIVQR